MSSNLLTIVGHQGASSQYSYHMFSTSWGKTIHKTPGKGGQWWQGKKGIEPYLFLHQALLNFYHLTEKISGTLNYVWLSLIVPAFIASKQGAVWDYQYLQGLIYEICALIGPWVSVSFETISYNILKLQSNDVSCPLLLKFYCNSVYLLNQPDRCLADRKRKIK